MHWFVYIFRADFLSVAGAFAFFQLGRIPGLYNIMPVLRPFGANLKLKTVLTFEHPLASTRGNDEDHEDSSKTLTLEYRSLLVA
jgi:hypothetical protein